MSYRIVLASYAAAVAMNSFLPANIGTWVMLLMFTTLFAGATFPMMFSGIVVQKIPFTVFNLALYLYLFLSVAGSFSVKLGFLDDHTGLVVLILVGAVVLLVLLARIFRQQLAGLREQVIGRRRGAALAAPLPARVVACRRWAATWRGWRSSASSSPPTASPPPSTTSPPSPPRTRSPTRSRRRRAASASPRR